MIMYGLQFSTYFLTTGTEIVYGLFFQMYYANGLYYNKI